jgi:hypothetical protein
MNENPIIDARSVSTLMKALDEVYGWKLPHDFPAGTPLGELWATPITVHENPAPGVCYLATATAPYPLCATLDAIVKAQVLSDTASAPTDPAVSRLTPPLEEYLA